VTYQPIWSHDGIPDADETGLLILYNQKVARPNTTWQRDRPLRNKGQRSRWLAAKFSLPGAVRELGIVVNHWSSNIHSESDAAYDRRRTADEIADLFRGAATLRLGPGPNMFDPDDDVILAGDFNCDPFDPVFHLSDKGAWAASHARAAVMAARGASLPCFYNPLLKAPNIDGTTGGGLKSRMVDYLLFSQSFLLGTGTGTGSFRYAEQSIRTSAYDLLASDHLAVGATFEMV
jgi:endonuclease/exonuclease/phosphatase family metal-dependent hydrolase